MRIEIGRYGVLRDATVEIPNGITAIVGPNGSGKSTIIDAIAFAIYGKDRFGGPADVSVQMMGQVFHRWRTGKNTRVLVRLDGEEYSQHGRAMEALEEKGWLDYDFAQAIWYARQGTVRFAQLTPQAKRLLVERLLDLSSIEAAHGIAKERLKKAEQKSQQIAGSIDHIKTTLDRFSKQAKEIADRLASLPEYELEDKQEIQRPPYDIKAVEEAERRIEELQPKLDELTGVLKRLNEQKKALTASEEEVSDRDRAMRKKIQHTEAELGELKRALEASSRPTPCTDEMRMNCPYTKELGADKDKEALRRAIELASGVLEDTKTEHSRVLEELDTIIDKLHKLDDKIWEVRQEINRLNDQLAEARKVASYRTAAERYDNEAAQRAEIALKRMELRARLETITKQAEDLEKDLRKAMEDQRATSRETNVWQEAVSDLGPSGLRHHLLASLVPKLTETMNDYLERLGSPFSARLIMEKELSKGGSGITFDVNLVRAGVEVSGRTASGGEAVLLDIAVRLTLMRAYREAGWVVPNLLVMDETLAPLDEHRRLAVLDGLKSLGLERILLTSHVSEVSDYADKVIDVEEL